MMELLSRKERFMALIKAFSDGANKSSSLKLVLYPSELVRFKKEFPELDFSTINMHKSATSKKYVVEVTRIK